MAGIFCQFSKIRAGRNARHVFETQLIRRRAGHPDYSLLRSGAIFSDTAPAIGARKAGKRELYYRFDDFRFFGRFGRFVVDFIVRFSLRLNGHVRLLCGGGIIGGRVFSVG